MLVNDPPAIQHIAVTKGRDASSQVQKRLAIGWMAAARNTKRNQVILRFGTHLRGGVISDEIDGKGHINGCLETGTDDFTVPVRRPPASVIPRCSG